MEDGGEGLEERETGFILLGGWREEEGGGVLDLGLEFGGFAREGRGEGDEDKEFEEEEEEEEEEELEEEREEGGSEEVVDASEVE